MSHRLPRILWGLTGSVAAIRADRLAAEFTGLGEVRAILTTSADRFYPRIPESVRCYRDADEWGSWKNLGDPVLHIQLRDWADILVLAPLSANSLAKLANGQCDNLLLSVARAWDFSKPIVVAPAMNTRMWEHPVTATQLSLLRGWGLRVIEPISKTLACGDTGIGALADADTIAKEVAITIERQEAGSFPSRNL